MAVVRNCRDTNPEWIRPDPKKQNLEFKWIDDGTAYLALNSFNDKSILKDYKKILPKLLKCKGVIIDLRYNGGGDTDIGYAILKHFIDKPIPTFIWKSRENKAVYKAWGRWTSELSPEMLANISEERKEFVRHYRNTAFIEGQKDSLYPAETQRMHVPTAVLTGNTGSADEDFLVDMNNVKNAVLIGKTTAGCTGTPYIFNLPSGGIAFVTTTIQMYPDGRKSRNGVHPDIEIHPSIENIIENRDPVLLKAIEVLRKQ